MHCRSKRINASGTGVACSADAMGVVRLPYEQQPDDMKNYILKTPNSETAEQATETESQKGRIAKQILLGIDVHENSYQVGRKIDAGGIQPVQSFKPDKLLGFVAKQLRLAEKVYVVYEAGPLGCYVLYRKL